MGKVKASADVQRSVMTGVVPPRPPIDQRTPMATPPPPPVVARAPSWTAPTPATPAPPAVAVVPAVTDPTAILDDLVVQIDGVRSAILASVDGFARARSSSMSDEASHPAMLAAAIGLAHQLVAMGGGSRLRQLVVDHDGGLMLVWPIGTQRVLAVLAATTVDQRRLRTFVQSHADQLAGRRP